MIEAIARSNWDLRSALASAAIATPGSARNTTRNLMIFMLPPLARLGILPVPFDGKHASFCRHLGPRAAGAYPAGWSTRPQSSKTARRIAPSSNPNAQCQPARLPDMSTPTLSPADIRRALLLREEIALLDLRYEAAFATGQASAKPATGG